VKKDFDKVSDQVKRILENAFTKVPEGLRFESVEILRPGQLLGAGSLANRAAIQFS
jgi:hypothetical protein